MTNYTTFPNWRKYGIVIKYSDHQYSWSDNSEAQRKYLLESTYCNNAVEFYVCENDMTYTKLEEFKKYLIEKQMYGDAEVCPLCGGKLKYKRNKVTQELFVGCLNYPECKFTKRA